MGELAHFLFLQALNECLDVRLEAARHDRRHVQQFA